MKKFTFILTVLIEMTITSKAQYSNATLNGAWFLYQTPLSPYNDSLLCLVFDGNGNITDWDGFGSITGSNYSVNTSGVITGTLVIVGKGSMPLVGQLSSQNIGDLLADGTNFVLSRISNQGALTSSITGILSTDNCGQKTVTITLDNQGIVTSTTGLNAPVSGRIYADLGVFVGHFKTGASDSWDEFSIKGYYSNNTLNGEVVLDATSCGKTSVQLIRKDATSIISVNSNATKIEIFPNPTNDIITIQMNKVNIDLVEINLFNVTGNLVKSKKLKQNQQQINVGDLGNGIYMVEIKSKEWTEMQKLIIKR